MIASHKNRFCVAIAAIALLLAGCEAARQSSAMEVPTLAGNEFGYDIQQYRGRTVRVCGRAAQHVSRFAVEYIPKAGDTFFHGYPAVLVVPCDGEEPRLDRDNCLTGRVAAADGSMNPPARNIHDDRPVDRDWFVHAQCRGARL